MASGTKAHADKIFQHLEKLGGYGKKSTAENPRSDRASTGGRRWRWRTATARPTAAGRHRPAGSRGEEEAARGQRRAATPATGEEAAAARGDAGDGRGGGGAGGAAGRMAAAKPHAGGGDGRRLDLWVAGPSVAHSGLTGRVYWARGWECPCTRTRVTEGAGGGRGLGEALAWVAAAAGRRSGAARRRPRGAQRGWRAAPSGRSKAGPRPCGSGGDGGGERGRSPGAGTEPGRGAGAVSRGRDRGEARAAWLGAAGRRCARSGRDPDAAKGVGNATTASSSRARA
nr:spidroin-1-like [Aegilops tauschii subsp. strangulata]